MKELGKRKSFRNASWPLRSSERATDREFANRKTIRANAFAECHKQPMKLRFSYVNFRAKTSYGNECHLTINTKRSLTKKTKCQLIIRSLKRHIWGLKFSIAEFFGRKIWQEFSCTSSVPPPPPHPYLVYGVDVKKR